MTTLYVFSTASNGGHRGAYDAVFEREFAAIGVSPVFVDRIKLSMFGNDIFFAMIEEAPAAFFLCALTGMVLGGRTIGLLFRPGECFRRGRLKNRLKFLLLRLFRRIAAVRVLTILPFSVDPRFAEVADDWIYDPQMWDRRVLGDLAAETSTSLSRDIASRAFGRGLIVALGDQSPRKGFDYLCRLWCSSPDLRANYLIAAAGQVVPESRAQAEALREAGGFVIDRFLSVEELSSLYAISTVVWAAYHPDYDQASGIVGRAYQFGIPVIVREGSYIADVMDGLGYGPIAIGFDDPREATRRLLAVRRTLGRRPKPSEASGDMERRFAEMLSRALDVAFPNCVASEPSP